MEKLIKTCNLGWQGKYLSGVQPCFIVGFGCFYCIANFQRGLLNFNCTFRQQLLKFQFRLLRMNKKKYPLAILELQSLSRIQHVPERRKINKHKTLTSSSTSNLLISSVERFSFSSSIFGKKKRFFNDFSTNKKHKSYLDSGINSGTVGIHCGIAWYFFNFFTSKHYKIHILRTKIHIPRRVLPYSRTTDCIKVFHLELFKKFTLFLACDYEMVYQHLTCEEAFEGVNF